MNMKGSGIALIALCAVFAVSSCSKINICGKDEKLVGVWKMDSYVIGDDSVINLIDSSYLFPGLDTVLANLGRGIDPYVAFTESGRFDYFVGIDTTRGSYSLERYETDCLLYINLSTLDSAYFNYRWEITSLSSDKMEISSFQLIGEELDSLVTTTYELSRFSDILIP